MGVLCLFMAPSHLTYLIRSDPQCVGSDSILYHFLVLFVSFAIPLFLCYFVIVLFPIKCKLHEGRAEVYFYLPFYPQCLVY